MKGPTYSRKKSYESEESGDVRDYLFMSLPLSSLRVALRQSELEKKAPKVEMGCIIYIYIYIFCTRTNIPGE